MRLQEVVPPRTDFYLGAATLAAFIAAVAIAYYQPFAPDADMNDNPFQLAARMQDRRIKVDWDATHPALQGATGATLTVHEAGVRKEYDVTSDVLASGGLDYLQSAPEALLSLTVHRPNEEDSRAFVRVISAVEPPRPAPTASAPKPRPPENTTRTRRGRRR